MDHLAASRLNDAAAALDAADRALVNLWVNHGLPDSAVGQMTGMGPETIAERRERIVERLSAELGVTPAQVDEALAASAPALSPANGNGNGSNGHAGAAAPRPGPAVEPPRPPAPAATGPRRRLVGWLSLAAVAVAAVVVALVLVLSGGPSRPARPHAAAVHRPAAEPAAVTTTAAPAPPAPVQTSPSPSPTVTRPPSPPLAALPGGLKHAHGTVFLSGHGRHLKLRLTVRSLPAARRGHYEVWLYNSIIDSRALARLRTGRHHLTVRLPPHAAHYRWIDVSFQPLGSVNHSGESVLRARNPARASRRQLRKRSARRRQLRRPARGSSSASRSK
jgi:hypothetical protein